MKSGFSNKVNVTPAVILSELCVWFYYQNDKLLHLCAEMAFISGAIPI